MPFKVSVLVPVHNAQATLRQALDSIAAQNMPEIEICAVDDGSTDSSADILAGFKKSFETVPGRTMNILTHAGCMGVAAARNTALDAVTGDWICFVDSDDVLSSDALETAGKVCDGADVIGWDWNLSSSEGIRYMEQPKCNSPEDALKALMAGTLRWNLWLFLIRRSIFNGIRFIPGRNMGEDMSGIARVMIAAGTFRQISAPLYTYIQREHSISKAMTEENLAESCDNYAVVGKALESSRYNNLAVPYLDLLKLNIKLPLLISRDLNDYRRWSQCFPEASKSIWRNTVLPFRTKLLQWMASKKLWSCVRAYNIIVYGKITKRLLCAR